MDYVFLQFDPDIVLVSAGFDSARGDPKVGGSILYIALKYIYPY